MTPTDPLYALQWHFPLIGDIETVWDDYNGDGVVVAVYDDGVEQDHPDLDDNYDESLELAIDDGDPNTSEDGHGTAVAGLIAAELNGEGGVGVAWAATITSVDFLSDVQRMSSSVYLSAFEDMANYDIVSNSWGTYGFSSGLDISNSSNFRYYSARAIEQATETGRGGLGTIVTKAAGNDATTNQYSSQNDGLNVSRHIITVGATDWQGNTMNYSNYGVNLLISAPAASYTTDLMGDGPGYDGINGNEDYTSRFGGTSAATPVTSGVVALMLEANPDLGWRDVQAIIAYSASHTGSDFGAGPRGHEDATWFSNGASTWNGGGVSYHINYGHGMIDAHAATRLAEVWLEIYGTAKTSANEAELVYGSSGGALNIEDNQTVQKSITVAEDFAIETIYVVVDATHTYMGDLTITLIAPDQTSFALNQIDNGGSTDLNGYTFAVNAALGMSAQGQWTLSIADGYGGDSGVFTGFSLEFYGALASTDTVYHFTDDFLSYAGVEGGRTNIDETDGGTDWVQMAAVQGDIEIDFQTGNDIQVDGAAWASFTSNTVENVATGDGNDTISGSDQANKILTGRGDDFVYGFGGDDTLDGGLGNNTIDGGSGTDELHFDGLIDDYTITELSDGFRVAGLGRVDMVTDVERFVFDDAVFDAGPIEPPPPPPLTPAARPDVVIVDEGEVSGDADLNVLRNDGTAVVSGVAGDAGSVGAWVAGSGGGMFRILADGSLDFDAAGAFETLGVGQSATTTISYTTIIEPVTAPAGGAAALSSVDPSAGVEIGVLDLKPNDLLPRNGSFTATAEMSGALDHGTITITDPDNDTFSDDDHGESARSSGSVDGITWTDIATDNERHWIIEDSEGTRIIVFQLQVEGSVDRFFWGATAELVEGETYQVIQRNKDPDPGEGVRYEDMVLANTVVEETTTVTVTVEGENDAPSVVGESYTTPQDQALLSLGVLDNDSDIDGDALSVISASALNGEVTINGNGTLSYDPDDGYVGPDTITYLVSDGQGGTTPGSASVTVTRANAAPTGDVAITGDATQGGRLTADTSAIGDADGLGSFSYQWLRDGVAIQGATGASHDLTQADVGALLSVEVSYTDGFGTRESLTAPTPVGPIANVNDTPDAVDDVASTVAGAGITIDVLANDSDIDGDALEVTSAVSSNGATVTINANGTLAYTPAINFIGTDTVTYTVSDGNSGTDQAIVSVTVTAATPAARPDVVIVDEGEGAGDADLNVLSNDGTAVVSGVAGDAGSVGAWVAGSGGGMFRILADGSLDFDAAGAFETLGLGQSATTSISYTTIIEPVGDPAGGAAASASVDPSAGVEIGVLDIEPDDFLPRSGTFTATSRMSGPLDDGTMIIVDTDDGWFSEDGEEATSSGSVGGQSWSNLDTENSKQWVVEDSDGNRITIFEIDVDDLDDKLWGATGELIEGERYRVVDYESSPDGSRGIRYEDMILTPAPPPIVEETTTVTVTVEGVNDAPSVAGESYTTPQDQALLSLGVLDNDSDIDGDALSVISASALNGAVTINGNGTLSYDPDDGYVGTDTITYLVSDGQGGTTPGSASVTVTRANAAPTGDVAITGDAIQGGRLTADTSAIGDADGLGSFSYQWLRDGVAIPGATGASHDLTQADVGAVLSVEVSYIDGFGTRESLTAPTPVGPIANVNDTPDAVDDVASTVAGAGITIDVLANDGDIDGDALEVISAVSANGATVTINANGTLAYTPATNFIGTDTVTYTVSDGNDGTDQAIVSVTVAPNAVDPSAGIEIGVLNIEPDDFLPRSGTFTATAQMSGVLDDGTMTIVDTDDGWFSEDGEEATSSGSVGGQSWSDRDTENDKLWVVEDSDGNQITIFEIDVDDLNDKLWGATGELIEGERYRVVDYESSPDGDRGVRYEDMVLATSSVPASSNQWAETPYPGDANADAFEFLEPAEDAGGMKPSDDTLPSVFPDRATPVLLPEAAPQPVIAEVDVPEDGFWFL